MRKINIQKNSINQKKPVDEKLHQMGSVPTLDLKDIDFSSKIVETFKQIGFCIITNHGIPEADINSAFTQSKNFFLLDNSEKMEIGFDQNMSRGYSGPGEEILDEQNADNEKKETLDLGHPEGPEQKKYYPKSASPEAIRFMAQFYEQLFQVNKQIMEALERGLRVPQGSIVNKCCRDMYNQTLRLLYYPEVSLQEIKKAGIVRAGAHSDYGTITLLLQKPGKGQNGLRALNSQDRWVRVNPPDYALVINLGDLFQHWSNDVLKSTIHKVEVDDQILKELEQGKIEKAPERQTIVMFCHPNKEEVLECLPGLGEPNYSPINQRQYTIGRVKSTCSVVKKS